ncbi:hypothetical protein A6767_01745 [Aeromonas veronii]|uniref:Uncharacterized protein n=1 Tax=Aeromonas veronii TaxID=654 RepID=A0AAW5MIJ7_AERVE|nr:MULTISPECIES: hypothetical protein [Aeromonas]MBW3834679.1 hypothetical protein [Aeromonas hydrophila]MBW5280309.1 hypothetical protein [Aeromonas hydrophila]MCR4450709.1 hypothetical protein [Aeromonas veronii]MDX7787717.1 hypothetical protein [Aeromonas caviae]MDX7800282.1 hypothetical protein [Aeromonas caviae]
MVESISGLPPVDKNELIAAGKYFGRIFLEYVWNLPQYRGAKGKDELSHELLTIGMAEREAQKDTLQVKAIIGMICSRQNIPYWLNYAAMKLALENNFKPVHPADSIGIVATSLKDFQSGYSKRESNKIRLSSLMSYIDMTYHVALPEAHYPIIIAYLEHRRYEVME